MSPARILSPESGLWSANGPKSPTKPLQKRQQHQLRDVDLAGDLKALWETRWKAACKRQSHPFQDASYLDVAPLMAGLIQRGVTSTSCPTYTTTFLTLAESLAADARASLLSPENTERASALLLRTCALLRIARFPAATSTMQDACALKTKAYQLQKSYYMEAVSLSGLNSPLDEVLIPHIHDPATHPDASQRGDLKTHGRQGVKFVRRPEIPAFVRVPLETLLTGQQCAVALIVSADRTGNSKTCEDVLSKGWACVMIEASEEGPEAESRMMSSVLDWMNGMFFFDMERVVIMADAEVATRTVASHGARVNGVVAYAGEQTNTETPVFAQSPLCRTLVVSGGVQVVVESSGLWTPPLLEEEAAAEPTMVLSAYQSGSIACAGQVETADIGRLYGWMEAVMDSSASEIEVAPLLLPVQSGQVKTKQRLSRWFSMDITPPGSDVEVASSLGSSLY
ncbi:hypothetical protein BD289DRAFT_172666 [Coniella lustricola]|uniref:Uncharacterized protein n=1 Tax=Coniella lustricola TaxID=2025994 RepID=A0A2T2ZTU3_9PEZI|nr:hypothetical protein BD289DRAFT_172666 [Coniella lustricola]